jgi:hypothetical protein
MEKPLHKRLFVFAVRERSRLMNSSGLYVPNSSRGSLTRAEDVWVLSSAADCRHSWKKGQHLLISDGFELEPVDFKFWDKHRDDEEFAFLKDFADKCDGRVHTTVVHEDSVIGEVEGHLIQEETMW